MFNTPLIKVALPVVPVVVTDCSLPANEPSIAILLPDLLTTIPPVPVVVTTPVNPFND